MLNSKQEVIVMRADIAAIALRHGKPVWRRSLFAQNQLQVARSAFFPGN